MVVLFCCSFVVERDYLHFMFGFKIPFEVLLVQKQTISHMKALVFSFYEPEKRVWQYQGDATPTSTKK